MHNVNSNIYWAGGFNAAGTETCNVEIRDLTRQTSSTASLFHPAGYVMDEGQNVVVKDGKIIWLALKPIEWQPNGQVQHL